MAVLSILVFASALFAAVYSMVTTVQQAMPRIADVWRVAQGYSFDIVPPLPPRREAMVARRSRVSRETPPLAYREVA